MAQLWLSFRQSDRHPVGINLICNRNCECSPIAKAYWITSYRSISDADKLAAYAKLAGPAIEGSGGRFLARSTAIQAYEEGRKERTVIIEFDSVEQAIAAHESAAYKVALQALADGAVRDLRIVSGV